MNDAMTGQIADALGHALGDPLSAPMPTSPARAIASGLDVLANPYLADGTVVSTGDTIVIGTCPLTEVELAGREGRRLVREGMADVLAWLGEEVELHYPSSAELMRRLREYAA